MHIDDDADDIPALPAIEEEETSDTKHVSDSPEKSGVAVLLDVLDTGAKKPTRFANLTVCPSCGHDKVVQRFPPEGGKYTECRRCHSRFSLKNPPTKEAIPRPLYNTEGPFYGPNQGPKGYKER